MGWFGAIFLKATAAKARRADPQKGIMFSTKRVDQKNSIQEKKPLIFRTVELGLRNRGTVPHSCGDWGKKGIRASRGLPFLATERPNRVNPGGRVLRRSLGLSIFLDLKKAETTRRARKVPWGEKERERGEVVFSEKARTSRGLSTGHAVEHGGWGRSGSDVGKEQSRDNRLGGREKQKTQKRRGPDESENFRGHA